MSYLKKRGTKGSVTSSKTYSLASSPFYRLERKMDLARLLGVSTIKVKDLIHRRVDLYSVRDDDSSGKIRTLSIPIKELRRCHQRIFRLLKRIRLPDYIRSPRIKSTAWANAALHLSGEFLTSFDVKAFYPSTTEEHVFRFFRYQLEMSDDCARQLAQLCTFNGFLPLGSPMSPHLACLTHLDLFDGADEIARNCNNRMSVWVDDVALSGPAPRRDIVGAIRRKALSKGLHIHKLQRGGGGRGVELTGAFIKDKKLAVANSSHKKIRDLTKQLEEETSPGEQYRILNRLAAMTRHQRTILRHGNSNTQRLDARLCHYKREMKRLNASLCITGSDTIVSSLVLENETAPF